MRDWYSSEPKNGLTRADVHHEIREFVQSQSLRGSMVPRSIPQISVDVPVVTALPQGAQDGSEVYFIADSDNGVVWHLRYRRAGSSDYPWEYVGGPPLYHNIATSEGQAATGVWGDLATVGPTITVPAAGDYIGRLSTGIFNNYAGSNRAYCGMALGANTPTQYTSTDLAANNHENALEHTLPFTGLSAGHEIRVRYFSVNNGHNFRYRTLTVTPVRVGRA